MPRKITAVALAASLAVLAGGSTLFAAGPANAGTTPFWNQVSQKLGISPSQLTGAIQATQIARIEAFGQAHNWSAAKIEQATQRIQNEHLGPPRIIHPLPGLKGRTILILAAKSLQLTPKQLVTELKQDHTLSAVASAHQVPANTLEQDILSTLDARVQKAVSNGHLSAKRAGAIEKRDQILIARWMTRDLTSVHWPKPLVVVALHRSAKFLGMKPAALRQALATGQTLAQVAAGHGKTPAELSSAILAPFQTQIQKQVDAHHLTAQQAQTRIQNLETRITQLVNRVFHMKTS